MDPVVTSQLPHQYHRQVERLNYNVFDIDNTRRQGQATQQRSVPSRHPNVVPLAPQRGGKVESSSRFPVQFSSSSSSSAAASASSTVLRCTCCPYGYHIDLGFLGFLDATDNLSQLRKIHRRRTIQRQTMETDLLMPRQDERFQQRYDISDGASTSSSMRSDDEDVAIEQNDAASTSRLLEEIDASIIDALSSIDVLMTSKPTAADVDDGRSVRDRVATVYDNEDATPAASTDGGSNELERRHGVWIEESSSSSSSVYRRSAWVSRGQSRSEARPEIVSKVHRNFTDITTSMSYVSSSVDQPPVFSSSSLELTPKDGLVSKSDFTGTFASVSSNCLSSGPSSVFTSFNDDSDQEPTASPYRVNNILSGVSTSASTTSYDNVPSARSHFFQPKTPDIVVADSTAELPNRRSSATLNKPVAILDQVAPHLDANNTNRTTISITTSGTLVPSTEISCGDGSVHLVSRNTPMQTSHTRPSDVGCTTERNSSMASGTQSSISFKLRPLKTISLVQRTEGRGLRAQKTAFVTDASVLSADSASSSSPEPSTSTTADTEAARSISARDSSTIDDLSETPPRIRIENSTNILNGGQRDISSVKSFTGIVESASTSNELFQSNENKGTSSKQSGLRVTQPPQQLHDHFHRRQHHQQQQQQQLRSSIEQSSLSQNDGVVSGDVRHTFQFPVGEVDNVETDSSNAQSTSSSEQLARAMAILMPIETSSSSTSDIDSRSSSVAVSPASTIDPDALIDIRRHIAASLQQMRFLERQVKAIPMLQVRLSVLKEEKRLLQLQLLNAKNIAAAAMAPTPTNANIRREDAGVQTLLNLDDVVSKKGHQTNVDGETEPCSTAESGDAMVHSSQPFVCSKCRTCFEKIDALVEQSSKSSASTNEREQQRPDAIHRLSPTSSPSESIVDTTRFMPTKTSTESLSSTTVKSVSGSVRQCRVVVAEDEFGDAVDALVSQHFTRQPEEVKAHATSGRGAKPPPVARKEISIGARDDKLQRRNVGVQCVLPSSDTSTSRFESSPPSPSAETVPIESKNPTDSVRISRRSSNGREPDLVVAHVTSSVPITEYDTVEDNACRSRSVEEFPPREAFYRKPDLIETGVNTDFVRIVNSELEDGVDVSGMNVRKGVVIRRSMPNQTDGDGDGEEVSERSEIDLVECALASTDSAADKSVDFIDSSKSVGARSNQEPDMTSPPRVHMESQTDICGPVTIVSMCDYSKPDAAIPQRRPRDSYFEDFHHVTETSDDDADGHVTHARRPANSMNSEDSSSDWSVSSAVRMNTDDVTCVFKKDEVGELFRMTPSPQHRETTAEERRSAVVRMPPTGSALRKEREGELWMLSHLDLQFSRHSTVGENISSPVRHRFDPTTANETVIAKCCVCSGLTGDRVLDNITPEVMMERMLKATCDVACNTPSLSQSATRETATITDDVRLRPLTVETGCDPLRIDACDISLRLGDWSETIPSAIVSEREMIPAENEISSVSFLSVTSSLSTSRTETAEVACETDSTSNSNLWTTISDYQFPTAMSRCFNDAGCNTILAQTMDSSSNTDDVTSGKPTPLTSEASCCTDAITTSDFTCFTDHVTPKPMMIDSSCGSDVQFELSFNDFTCNPATTFTRINTIEMGMNTDPSVVYSMADKPETHDNGTNTDEQTADTLVTKTASETAERDDKERHSFQLIPSTTETGCDPIQIDDSDKPIGQSEKLATCPLEKVLERNDAAAENELVFSTIFSSVTSSLPTSRNETAEVACETDSILNSDLSATISDDQFQTVMSRCFNDAGCNTVLTQTVDLSSNTDDVTSGKPTPLTIEASCCTDAITTSDVTCFTDHVTPKPMMIDSSCGSDVHFELSFNVETASTKANTFEMGINTDPCAVYLSAVVPETQDNGTNTDEHRGHSLVTKTVAVIAKPESSDCACEANLVFKPDVVDAASNTDMVDRGSQEISHNVDRTSDQLTYQSRAVGTVRPRTAAVEDSFSDQLKMELGTKYVLSMMTSTTVAVDNVIGSVSSDAGYHAGDRTPHELSRLVANITQQDHGSPNGAVDSIVGRVLLGQEKSTQTAALTVGDLSGLFLLEESDGKSDELLRRPSREDIADWSLADGASNTEHRMYVRTRSLGADVDLESVSNGQLLHHASIATTAAVAVQASSVTRDADCNTDALPPPPAALVKCVVADAANETDDEFRTRAVDDDVTVHRDVRTTSFGGRRRARDTRRSITTAIDEGESVTYFKDFTVPSIDTVTEETEEFRDRKTANDVRALTDAIRTWRPDTRDASCNTDETRMNSASVASCSVDGARRPSTELYDIDPLSRRSPHAVGDDSTTTVERHVTHVATELPVCPVSKPLVRDAACNTDVANDNDIKVFVKPLTRETASNTESPPHSRDVFGNTNQIDAVKPEVADFACYVNLPRESSSLVHDAARTTVDSEPDDGLMTSATRVSIPETAADELASTSTTSDSEREIGHQDLTPIVDMNDQRQKKTNKSHDLAVDSYEAGKSSLATAGLYTGNVPSINSLTSVDIVTTSATRTVVSMQSGAMLVENVEPSFSEFGYSVNNVARQGHIADASCQKTDLMSSVEVSVSNRFNVIRELESKKTIATSTRRKSEVDSEADVDSFGSSGAAPLASVDFGCGVDMTVELGASVTVDASCDTESASTLYAMDVEYASDDVTIANSSEATVDPDSVTSSVPVQAQTVTFRVALVEAESNTDRIQVLTIQEYEDLISFVTAMKSSAPIGRDLVDVTTCDAHDSASAAAASSSMCNNTETVEDLHRDVVDFSCTSGTIDDITLTSSTLTSPTDDSSAIFADLASKTRVESSSTSNKVDGVIRRQTTADASCGSETSNGNPVSDVACGDDVVFEFIEAAASPAAVKLSTADVGCCTESHRPGSAAVAVKDAYNDAWEFPVSEASSNTETTVYCSRCLCGEPTSGESASVSQSNDAKNGVYLSAKSYSVSVGCSTDIRQVAEVASGVDIDDVPSSVALRSCKTETRDQCCNTEPQLEVKDASTFESMIEITKTTLADGGRVEQPRRRRTLSSSLYSPMSSNSAASASKIPTRRRSAKTHDSAVNTNVTTIRDSAENTDITIAPCTMATVDFEKSLITKGQSFDANLPALTAAAAESDRSDSDVPTIDQPTVMPTMSGHPNRNVEMRKSVQTRDVGCCAIPASIDASCGTDQGPFNAVSASASTTGNPVRRTSSESREKLGGKAYAADSVVVRKRPPTMRNASCTADLGASTLAAATTAAEVSLPSPVSVTSSSSLRTPTSDVACGTDFEFLSRIAASSDNDTSHFNWHSLASMRTPVAATVDDDDENVTSGSIRRSRPRRLDLDEVRDVACNTEHDSKPISGVLTSPYFARGVSYFPPPVSTADVACETDPSTDAVAGVVSSLASDHIHRSAPPPSLDVGELQAVAPSSDSRRSLSSGGNRMFDALSAEKTFRGTRLSYSEGSLAVFDDKNNRQQGGGGGDNAIEQNAEVVGHKVSPTSEALATLRQYITHNLREQRKQVDVTQTVFVRSPVTLCDISVGPDESHIDDQPPSITSTTSVTIGNSMTVTVTEPPSETCDQSDSRVRPDIMAESGHQDEDLHRLKPPSVGDAEDGSFHPDTVGDLRSAASHDKVDDERSKNIGVQTEAVDELALYSPLTDATIHHSSTAIKTFAQLADRKRKSTMNKAVNTTPASTRTKSINTVPPVVQTKWTMTEDQLDTANRFVQIPTITIDDCGTPSALPSSIHQRPVTQSTEDFNNNRQHPARVSIRSNVVISSVTTDASSPKSGTLGSGDADNEQNSPRLSAGSETDVSQTTELPPSGGSSAASHLTRRWGTVDLSEEKQSPTGSASGGRKRSGTSASCSSSSSSVAMTTTSFKSILKHSRSVDTNTQSGLNKTVPRKAISFSQDVIFKGEVEDEFVPDSSSSFEGEVFSDDSSRNMQTSYESLTKYSTTTEATSTVQLEMSVDLSSACETYALWLRDSTEVTSKKLNHSIKVIRNEWFAMTCQKTSLSELVAGFLRQVSELSLDLLKQVVNMVDDNGNTAIHYAMSNGRFDVVRCLLDSGCCDVGRQNRTGCTAIMLASLVPVSTDDDRQVIERLMTVGDVNQRAALAGQTALMLAASRDRGDIVRMLLDAGADVNAQDDDGSTAVMCASEHGFVDVVRMLLSHPECDPTVVDNEGSSATSIAIEAGHQDIAVLLYAHSNFKKTSSTSKRRRLKLPKTSTSSDPKSPKTT